MLNESNIYIPDKHSTAYLVQKSQVIDPRLKKIPDAYHAFAGAQIPFLPTSELLQTAQHPDYLARELFRRFLFFTEAIAAIEPNSCISIRIINQLDISRQNPNLKLWLVAKCALDTKAAAIQGIQGLWSTIKHIFPTEVPFGYPMEICSRDDIQTQQNRFHPKRIQQIITFSKFWDEGFVASEAFPHPFRQKPAIYALLPLFAALAASPHKVILSITLRPGKLWRKDQAIELLQRYGATDIKKSDWREKIQDVARQSEQHDESVIGKRARSLDRELARVIRMREDEFQRARLGAQVIDNLLRNQDRLLEMRVTLVSGHKTYPASLIQAIRSSLSGRTLIDNSEESFYCNPPEVDCFIPNDGIAFQRALDDVTWLEQSFEGETTNARWRTLVTPEEAVSLFSLPMPSELVQIPGVITRSQPYFMPVEPIQRDQAGQDNDPGLGVGNIIHRGIPTNIFNRIPIHKLDQHVLIAGRSGSGKTNTTLLLLLELARRDVPFLVLDPLDKGDYRLLLGDGLSENLLPPDPERPSCTKANHQLNTNLRIYTLGESTSPFVFNPFHLPPGITVQKHISQLLRCFLTAYAVGDPIPAIYRTALRQVYLQNGWQLDDHVNFEQSDKSKKLMPIFRQFFDVLQDVVDKRTADYSAEIRGNIRQMTLLRIGSLLEENSPILNVDQGDSRDPMEEIVCHPTVLELGHIGSDEDKALIMAFLITCLIPHIQNRQPRGLHITVIEEAHRLMRRGGNVSELRGDATGQTRADFSHLLAEVRGYDQGIIVADQSPSELVSSVFSNTATHIMHHLRDPQSFDMMSSSFVLNQPQANYARRLKIGEAITETSQGTPIHICLPNISDLLRDAMEKASLPDGSPYFDAKSGTQVVSDQSICKLMQTRSIEMPDADVITDYETLQMINSGKMYQLISPPSLPKEAPYPICVGCLPLWEHGKCLYVKNIKQFRQSENRDEYEANIRAAIQLIEDNEKRWIYLNDRLNIFAKIFNENPEFKKNIIYCELVHLTNVLIQNRHEKLDNYFEVLRDFHSRFKLAFEEK